MAVAQDTAPQGPSLCSQGLRTPVIVCGVLVLTVQTP